MGSRIVRVDRDHVPVELLRLCGRRHRAQDRQVEQCRREVGVDLNRCPVVLLGSRGLALQLVDQAEVVVGEGVARVVRDRVLVVGGGIGEAAAMTLAGEGATPPT